MNGCSSGADGSGIAASPPDVRENMHPTGTNVNPGNLAPQQSNAAPGSRGADIIKLDRAVNSAPSLTAFGVVTRGEIAMVFATVRNPRRGLSSVSRAFRDAGVWEVIAWAASEVGADA